MFLRLLLLSVSLTGLISALSGAPNIILILTDDQGWSQLSDRMDPSLPTSKSDYLESPNMNRLMQSGMRFTSGYSPAPLCTPTRRAIQCGTTAARSGSEFSSPNWIPADHLTIPKALKAANRNYRAAHFGKWGEQMISTPEDCGYDASDGMTGNNTGGMPKTLGVASGSHTEGPPHFIDNEDPKRTPTLTTRAISFMTDQVRSGHPFYLQVSYYAQHLSVVTRQSLLDKYVRKGVPDRGYTQAWAAMMEELDNGVGRLIDAVEDLKIRDNTYVFFTTDNGGRGTVPGGDESATAPNYPLSGAKHSLLEGGIRVPFFVMGPGIKAGSVCRTPVAGYDFLPTFVDLAGGKTSILTPEIDGISIVSLLRGETAGAFNRPGEALFFHRPRRSFSAIRRGDYKLMLYWNKDGSESHYDLYRVDDNPTELGNEITTQQPVMSEALRNQLLAYLFLVDAERK
ncbi:MAG: sulfatase [Verrucomicrobiae bacterium]|nr:sulfatase [Verrucomicrobiae bacterium]